MSLLLQMVANSRSSEAFVAACLLTVGGSSLLTKQMGLSDTLGAFVAGVLLSETSFRTQVGLKGQVWTCCGTLDSVRQLLTFGQAGNRQLTCTLLHRAWLMVSSPRLTHPTHLD